MTVTRYIGKCPVCEGDFRLHKLTMVHHGYKRPGYGEIVGDCFGVGYPPYELSTEGTEHYLAAVERGIAGNERMLAELTNDPQSVTVLKMKVTGFGRRDYEPVTYTPADGYEFRSALQSKIREVERSQERLRDEQRRCEHLIRDWVKRPVRTEEEDMAQKAQVTQARRAVIDEARATRQARRDAIDAKNAARAQERQGLIEHYRDVFVQLADEGDVDALRTAKLTWVQMHKSKGKKGYLDFYPSELGADRALVALGLAEINPRAYGGQYLYSNDLGWDPR